MGCHSTCRGRRQQLVVSLIGAGDSLFCGIVLRGAITPAVPVNKLSLAFSGSRHGVSAGQTEQFNSGKFHTSIWAGKFYTAGEALPVASVADLTENLQKVVATSEPEAEEPNEPRGNFETGVIYEMTDDGRLGRTLRRKVQRQVAELEAAAQEDDWIEEQAATAELPPEIAEGLQAEHERHVDMQKAQLAVDADRSDAASNAAAEVL